jgi:hypothetical protein
MAVIAVDLDEDEWTDIYVACESTPSLLFMNNTMVLSGKKVCYAEWPSAMMVPNVQAVDFRADRVLARNRVNQCSQARPGSLLGWRQRSWCAAPA